MYFVKKMSNSIYYVIFRITHSNQQNVDNLYNNRINNDSYNRMLERQILLEFRR